MTVQAEIFLAMNEEGDFAVATDAEAARDTLIEEWGGAAVRIVKLSVHMTPPAFEEDALEVAVPDEAPATAAVAQP